MEADVSDNEVASVLLPSYGEVAERTGGYPAFVVSDDYFDDLRAELSTGVGCSLTAM